MPCPRPCPCVAVCAFAHGVTVVVTSSNKYFIYKTFSGNRAQENSTYTIIHAHTDRKKSKSKQFIWIHSLPTLDAIIFKFIVAQTQTHIYNIKKIIKRKRIPTERCRNVIALLAFENPQIARTHMYIKSNWCAYVCVHVWLWWNNKTREEKIPTILKSARKF